MPTEALDPRFLDIDGWPVADALAAMWEGQAAAVAAVYPALPAIGAAILPAAAALRRGGRLVYVGAGTSGRIAAQDGAELTPTYNWPATRVQFVLAGGPEALLASVEGAEDDAADAVRHIGDAGIGPDDVVIGVAASGQTPFTCAAVQEAARRGAITIGIANNAGTRLLAVSAFPVLVGTGSEIVAGSTRMKAGTAQKIVLNLVSTALMLQLGGVYQGMMVNMQVANAKLHGRAIGIITRIARCTADEARAALDAADQQLKLAIVIAHGLPASTASALLASHGGHLRSALADLPAAG